MLLPSFHLNPSKNLAIHRDAVFFSVEIRSKSTPHRFRKRRISNSRQRSRRCDIECRTNVVFRTILVSISSLRKHIGSILTAKFCTGIALLNLYLLWLKKISKSKAELLCFWIRPVIWQPITYFPFQTPQPALDMSSLSSPDSPESYLESAKSTNGKSRGPIKVPTLSAIKVQWN